MAKIAAYSLLRIMYLALPATEIKEAILKPYGGNGVRSFALSCDFLPQVQSCCEQMQADEVMRPQTFVDNCFVQQQHKQQ